MASIFSPSLVEGIVFHEEKVVKETDLDTYWGIGKLNVLATPVLITYMEQSIISMISQYIDPGYETVCLEMNFKHIQSAQMDDKLTCNVHLKYIDDKKLFFDVAVLNADSEKIGFGSQERIAVKR